MNFGICALSVVPVRSSASYKSEMVSQLLFGEMVELLEKKGTWAKVRCSWDNYIGWIDVKQIKIITPSEHNLYKKNHAPILGLCSVLSPTCTRPICTILFAHERKLNGLQSLQTADVSTQRRGRAIKRQFQYLNGLFFEKLFSMITL